MRHMYFPGLLPVPAEWLGNSGPQIIPADRTHSELTGHSPSPWPVDVDTF